MLTAVLTIEVRMPTIGFEGADDEFLWEDDYDEGWMLLILTSERLELL